MTGRGKSSGQWIVGGSELRESMHRSGIRVHWNIIPCVISTYFAKETVTVQSGSHATCKESQEVLRWSLTDLP